MDRRFSIGLAMIASALFGAVAGSGLNAQGKSPGAYAIVDISEMTDPNLFKDQLLPKVTPAILAASGGHYLVRTDKATARDGTPPARFVVIAFDDMAKANAWATSPSQKEVDAIRMKSTKSRQFLVEGLSN
jgi:uncharacterized protein (DUF1330 family)